MCNGAAVIQTSDETVQFIGRNADGKACVFIDVIALCIRTAGTGRTLDKTAQLVDQIGDLLD